MLSGLRFVARWCLFCSLGSAAWISLRALLVCKVHCNDYVSLWRSRLMFRLWSEFVARGRRTWFCDVTAQCFNAGVSIFTDWLVLYALVCSMLVDLLAERSVLSKRDGPSLQALRAETRLTVYRAHRSLTLARELACTDGE